MHKIAYLAGLVDGEGSITIYCPKPSEYPCPKHPHRTLLAICNCHAGVLYWIQKHFGGSVHWISRGRRFKPSGKIMWGTAATALLLKQLLPFLIVKKEQARLAVRFQATMLPRHKWRSGLSLRILESRERLAQKLKQLNRRGA